MTGGAPSFTASLPFVASAVASTETLSAFSTHHGVMVLDQYSRSLKINLPCDPFPIVDIKQSQGIATVAYYDGTGLFLQDLESNRLAIPLHSDLRILSLKYACHGLLAISGLLPTDQPVIMTFDPRSGEQIESLKCPRSTPITIAWNEAKEQLIAASFGTGVRVWDRRQPSGFWTEAALSSEAISDAEIVYPESSGASLSLDWSGGTGNSLFGCVDGQVVRWRLHPDQTLTREVMTEWMASDGTRNLELLPVQATKVVSGISSTVLITSHRSGLKIWDAASRPFKEISDIKTHGTLRNIHAVAVSNSEFGVSGLSRTGSYFQHQVVPLPEGVKRRLEEADDLPTDPTVPGTHAAEKSEISYRAIRSFEKAVLRIARKIGAKVVYDSEAGSRDEKGERVPWSESRGVLLRTLLILPRETIFCLSLTLNFSILYNISDSTTPREEQPTFETLSPPCLELILSGKSRWLLLLVRTVLAESETESGNPESVEIFPASAGVCWSPSGALFRFCALRNVPVDRKLHMRDFQRQPESDDEEAAPPMRIADQCIQWIQAAHFEGRIEEHWFSAAAHKYSLSGEQSEMARRNFHVCQGNGIAASSWTMVSKLFGDRNALPRPLVPVAASLAATAFARLFEKELTQPLAVLATTLALKNKTGYIGPATPADSESTCSSSSSDTSSSDSPSSVLHVSESLPELLRRTQSFSADPSAKKLRPSLSLALLRKQSSQASIEEDLEISRKETLSPRLALAATTPAAPKRVQASEIVSLNPLLPEQGPVVSAVVQCLHSHSNMFQQISRFPASRILEKVQSEYRSRGMWKGPLLQDGVHGEHGRKQSNFRTPNCSVCGFAVHGLIKLCAGCGHGGHIKHIGDYEKGHGGRCAVHGCSCVCALV